ncbi:hypothetical protein CPC08DRAFT_347511 [Agrocybe pediades]|nr:hypothetical protein CPC08DRAFT_347511 [Agrocybe pediades]
MLPHSAMISSNQGVFITGGQFNQYNNNCHGQATLGNKAPIDILMESVATSALHDSGATFDKPKCHPRTRVKIREIIMNWIVGEDEDARAGKQFMWLNGAAGCGKSAIAQSTVESCIEQGLLLGSFFFNRSDSTRNHAGALIATLAYQLYRAFRGPEVQKDILSAIQEDPLILKNTIQQQFTSLIIRPLMNHFSKDRSTQQPVPFLIVVDGLDECIDRNAQKAILTGLAESVRDSNLRIPIFVASRPEHDIKLSFGFAYLKDMHINLSLDLQGEREADSDIRLYLIDRFAQIKDDFDNRTTGRKLSVNWPGNTVIETLVWQSSRQFVYAATVIRYVESTRHRPDHQIFGRCWTIKAIFYRHGPRNYKTCSQCASIFSNILLLQFFRPRAVLYCSWSNVHSKRYSIPDGSSQQADYNFTRAPESSAFLSAQRVPGTPYLYPCISGTARTLCQRVFGAFRDYGTYRLCLVIYTGSTAGHSSVYPRAANPEIL